MTSPTVTAVTIVADGYSTGIIGNPDATIVVYIDIVYIVTIHSIMDTVICYNIRDCMTCINIHTINSFPVSSYQNFPFPKGDNTFDIHVTKGFIRPIFLRSIKITNPHSLLKSTDKQFLQSS